MIPLECLARCCPVCHGDTIIGHGRRRRQCHDDQHECIWVRRGLCRPCGKTFTILPDWLAPSGHYSLHCRQQCCERIAAGDPVEQAAPHCKDSTRLPDASTVRRWAQRRLISIWFWINGGAITPYRNRPPRLRLRFRRSRKVLQRLRSARGSYGKRGMVGQDTTLAGRQSLSRTI